jgi:hypothetical protein
MPRPTAHVRVLQGALAGELAGIVERMLDQRG